SGTAVFRPSGSQPFVQFPFVGGAGPNFAQPPGTGWGGLFGFPASTIPPLGTPRPGSFSNFGPADNFPGYGSVVGSILPGLVLSTGLRTVNNTLITVPLSFTVAPSYLPDAPFINRLYGQSSFSTFTAGAKFLFTGPNNNFGAGVVGYYQWYADHATTAAGFNQLQRGASPGGNFGDFGAVGFVSGRLSRSVNLSANFGFQLNSNPKGEFGSTDAVLLDRPNELMYGVGFDFPINKYFQPIAEFKGTKYLGGTDNAFGVNPLDLILGARIYPRRWFGFGAAFRWNLNQQQDPPDTPGNANVVVNSFVVNGPNAPSAVSATFITVPNTPFTNFRSSEDPYGFILQFLAGKRNKAPAPAVNRPPTISSVTLSSNTITIPCPPGSHSRSGCSDVSSVSVSTRAMDPENDPVTYTYGVTGGRIVGSGANVTWDLGGVSPGTYTITTSVADGCTSCSKSDTETVTVKQCPDCVANCSCPTLSVSGPTNVAAAGQPMSFAATSSGDVTYNWMVSAGHITSGQGSSNITVDTTGLAGQSVTATVEISGGGMCSDCPRTQSASGEVARKIEATLVDEYGKLKDDDVKARIDGYYTQLNNDPSSHGYIIIYGTPAQIKIARAQIDKAIAFRKFDASRVTIVTGSPMGPDVHVKLYSVPAGADNPMP
ncbi:MAG: hypothetical protein JO314_03980, partial [Acidobacteria bacterium]|nr:hypothetical protein [Acidobacteriota bacterium]